MTDTADPIIESPVAQIRRRYQQKKCLVCGARNRASGWALFCAAHITTHRYCAICETVRLAEDYGSDRSRCRACSRTRALAHYYGDPERSMYRMRLRQIHTRAGTRGDQIMDGMRRRIALAALVKATPGMSWPKRGALIGRYGPQLAYNYRMQCQGMQLDADTPDRAKRKRGRHGA
jgi:hypothetical protein